MIMWIGAKPLRQGQPWLPWLVMAGLAVAWEARGDAGAGKLNGMARNAACAIHP
jgi:hypothetical protein